MNQTIFLAAGCFWGVQYYFDQVDGVVSTEVGYMNGHYPNPTYEDVCYKNTGHAEAVKVMFDDQKVELVTVLKQFFYMHDPTQLNKQGPDVGQQYRSAIFYTNDNQRKVAEKLVQQLSAQYDNPIVSEISEADVFYEAEEYHQKYTEKTGRGICHKPFKKL